MTTLDTKAVPNWPLPNETWVRTFDRRMYSIFLPVEHPEGKGYVCWPANPNGSSDLVFIWHGTIAEFRLPS